MNVNNILCLCCFYLRVFVVFVQFLSMAISHGGAQSASSTVGGSRWISRCSQIQRRVLEITLLNTSRKRGLSGSENLSNIYGYKKC